MSLLLDRCSETKEIREIGVTLNQQLDTTHAPFFATIPPIRYHNKRYSALLCQLYLGLISVLVGL